MSIYEKVSIEPVSVREQKIIDFWTDNDIFQKSINIRNDCPPYVFYDGPPTANGMPHIGHVLTRVIKDLFPRYYTMKGFKVLRKAGWDTHGLPVELEVEKQLGISGKPNIEKYGVENFVQRCKESVWKYKQEWEKMSARVGYWADMEHPYITYENNYIESVWFALKQIWNMGLLYKGHKIIPYCPRCGTSLSSHEVAQGYKEVKEVSVVVKFEIEPGEYILAWTTTPWTLPANLALAVNPDQQYAKVKVGDENFILAKDLVDEVLKSDYQIIDVFCGSKLNGISYKPLFDYTDVFLKDGKRNFVVTDSYVTLTDGTGVVHIAPFGEDDARIISEHGIEYVNLIDTQGKFVEKVKDFAGMFVKDADKLIIENLKTRGLLFRTIDFAHSYPFCWRCDTHLLYYPCDTWFIKMSTVREKLVANNQKINWLPDNIKEGRFGNFISNVIDWGLSRSRYWGTPLPIWECPSCGKQHCIGSIQELKGMASDVSDDIELHKPYIDQVLLKCPNCAAQMKRVPEVIDCWFDAGSMPFAQWHYPFENKDLFEQTFPADFISEAVDQTRGWFYTLLAISTLMFDKQAYKNVIVLGHIQDKHGIKMSKHKGNVVDPWTILNKQGADAIRWYFYLNSAPWLPSKFHEDAVAESQRKFVDTLWNIYSFYVLYANIDNFDPREHELDVESLGILDKWILVKLNRVITKTDESLQNYRIVEGARCMQDFIEELSNWYVRRSRVRFWESGMPQDKVNAYMTLYNVLVNFVKLSAPFIPFMSEQIYQNLVISLDKDAVMSVHLCDYPRARSKFWFDGVEENMDTVLKIVTLGRACRNSAKVKNRQPLSKIYVQFQGEVCGLYKQIILDELNIKDMELKSDVTEFIRYNFKPQLRTMGPKYGKIVAEIFRTLNSMKPKDLMDRWSAGDVVTLFINQTEVKIGREDVLIEVLKDENFVSDSDSRFTVVLDTTLTPELIEEGFVREIVSKIQNMRKDANFDVLDNIIIRFKCYKKLEEIIQKNEIEIKNQTLAVKIEYGENSSSKVWEINGERVKFSVEKI